MPENHNSVIYTVKIAQVELAYKSNTQNPFSLFSIVFLPQVKICLHQSDLISLKEFDFKGTG